MVGCCCCGVGFCALYRKSDMLLAVHSDASYLSEPKMRSRAAGHFFLASDVPISANNGAVLNTANLIKTVMSGAVEAEMGAIFLNAREAIPARNALIEMGHPQVLDIARQALLVPAFEKTPAESS